jgi:PAS domain S-box-containing protein
MVTADVLAPTGSLLMTHLERGSASSPDGSDPMLIEALQKAAITLFSCDQGLRYTGLANPPPGLATADVLGRRDDEVFPSDEAAILMAFKGSVLASAQPAVSEMKLTIGRRAIWVEVRADVLRNSEGQVTGLSGAFVDVGSRKEADERAQRAAEHERILSQATREGVLLHDGERVIEANEAFCRMFGLSRDEIGGRDPMTFVAPVSRAYATARAAAGARGPDEFFGQRRDGTSFPMEVIVQRFDYRGRSLRIAHVRDLTAQKQAEATMRESEERYRALAAATREGVIIHDGERIVEVNDAFCTLHGTTRESAIGRPAYTFIVRETRPAAVSEINTASTDAYEALARREDGSLFPIEAAGRPILFQGRLMRVATIRDLSDRKSAEAALRDSEERLRGFAEASSDVLWVVDAATRRIEYLSPAYERVWGEERTALLQDPSRWLERLHPEDRDRMADMLARSIAGERIEVEYRIVRPDGTVRWIRDSGFPIRGADGTVRRAAGLARDITHRKEIETQQKLLLGELNHRVKNTLATVQSIAQQTLRYAPSLSLFRERFEDRILALSKTHDLLTQESWERASLLSLLKQELSPYGKGRYHLGSSEDVHLAPRAAVAFGMALHELTTNAAKHGALSVSSGSISLTWSVVDAPERRLRLDWSERGGPPIREAPSRRGFGSRLLQRGIAAELGGKVTLNFGSDGLDASIEVPLDVANIPLMQPPDRA